MHDAQLVPQRADGVMQLAGGHIDPVAPLGILANVAGGKEHLKLLFVIEFHNHLLQLG